MLRESLGDKRYLVCLVEHDAVPVDAVHGALLGRVHVEQLALLLPAAVAAPGYEACDGEAGTRRCV